MTKPNIIRQDEINVIFVRSELDDARLTPHEFRIYAHIARRSNCFASLESMADICQMSQATIKRVLASLKEKGMIDLISRPGTTHLISITPPRVWSDQTWANIELSREVVLRGVERPEPSSQGATHDPKPGLADQATQLTDSSLPSSQGATKDIPLRESHKREQGADAIASPQLSEELRSIEADPPSPTQSAAHPPTPRKTAPICPWHLDHGLSLPEPLRTTECLESARLWLQYKRETRSRLCKTGFETQMKQWARDFTPETLPAAIERSMSRGWKGVFPPDGDRKRDSAHTQPQRDPAAVLYDEIRACRGWPQHMEHDKATDEEKAQYASLKAKRKELIQ